MPLVHWIRVTRTCNNVCSFCSESAALDGVPVPLEELEAAVDGILATLGPHLDAVEVRLSGGEPTLSPHLPAIIESVARRGLSPVLVTNGRAMAKPGRLSHLVDRGLAAVRISLHGATPATHDAMVGVPGAFRQTLTALALAATVPVRRTVSFVLTNANVEELPALFDLMKRSACEELEIRDVLPTADRERHVALRVPDDTARRALEDAAERAQRANVHLRTIGFERTATNTRRSAFAVGARWPNASAAPAPPRPPARVVILGPNEPVTAGSTMTPVAEALEQRRIPIARMSRSGPFDLTQGDLVLCTSYADATALFEREPGAEAFDVRVMDFHMLADFGAFRTRWMPDARQRATTRWWPSKRLAIISCFPGYAALYAWYGVPSEALLLHPYLVDPRYFEARTGTPSQPYAFSGGQHLRDTETLAIASALRRSPETLPIHLYHYGPAGPPAAGLDYRGEADFRSFCQALAGSRFVVLPLSRDPTCAAGITVAAMALAAGRAVVASATPAMRDHLDDGVNALLVEPEDPHALAQAIERLERDHELRAKLEQGAREAARMSTAETFVDVLLGRSPPGLLSPAP